MKGFNSSITPRQSVQYVKTLDCVWYFVAPEPPLRVTRPGSIQTLSSGHIVIIAVEHAGVVSFYPVLVSSSSKNRWVVTDELGGLLSVGIVPNTKYFCIRPLDLQVWTATCQCNSFVSFLRCGVGSSTICIWRISHCDSIIILYF